jgi:hypothetical protein
MKNLELSESISNLLVVSALGAAILPFVLGDKLVLIVVALMHEGAVLVDQVGSFVLNLVR